MKSAKLKLIAIGDLHGSSAWKRIVFADCDKAVFIGDYVDGMMKSDREIYSNLEELVQLKQSQPEKVVLLLGNHDVQYLHYPDYRCAGFRPDAQKQLTAFFKKHRSLFQMAWQSGKYMFTHAGVSNSWFRRHKKLFLRYSYNGKNLAEVLNAIYQNAQDRAPLFEIGPAREGTSRYGGILWADAEETCNDFLDGYHQVVGHTPMPKIKKMGNKKSSITYIDLPEYLFDYLQLEI